MLKKIGENVGGFFVRKFVLRKKIFRADFALRKCHPNKFGPIFGRFGACPAFSGQFWPKAERPNSTQNRLLQGRLSGVSGRVGRGVCGWKSGHNCMTLRPLIGFGCDLTCEFLKSENLSLDDQRILSINAMAQCFLNNN